MVGRHALELRLLRSLTNISAALQHFFHLSALRLRLNWSPWRFWNDLCICIKKINHRGDAIALSSSPYPQPEDHQSPDPNYCLYCRKRSSSTSFCRQHHHHPPHHHYPPFTQTDHGPTYCLYCCVGRQPHHPHHHLLQTSTDHQSLDPTYCLSTCPLQ